MSEDDLKEVNVPAAVTYLKRAPAVAAPPGKLETLFRENYDQIYRTAYRITGSASDAEDVLQTVFLRLARRDEVSESLSPSPAAYLRRAAVNAALDLIRYRKRTASVSLTESEAGLRESSQSSPEAQHARGELRDLMRAAIARLGERAAEVFTLRYLEGYDNREIAELIGTSQMVVAVTLHRSRGRLRKEIGKYLEGHHEAQL